MKPKTIIAMMKQSIDPYVFREWRDKSDQGDEVRRL